MKSLSGLIESVLEKYPHATVRDHSDISKIIAKKIEDAGFRPPLEKDAARITLFEDGCLMLEVYKLKDEEITPPHVVVMGGLAIKLGQSEFLEEITDFVHGRAEELKKTNLH